MKLEDINLYFYKDVTIDDDDFVYMHLKSPFELTINDRIYTHYVVFVETGEVEIRCADDQYHEHAIELASIDEEINGSVVISMLIRQVVFTN